MANSTAAAYGSTRCGASQAAAATRLGKRGTIDDTQNWRHGDLATHRVELPQHVLLLKTISVNVTRQYPDVQTHTVSVDAFWIFAGKQGQQQSGMADCRLQALCLLSYSWSTLTEHSPIIPNCDSPNCSSESGEPPPVPAPAASAMSASFLTVK